MTETTPMTEGKFREIAEISLDRPLKSFEDNIICAISKVDLQGKNKLIINIPQKHGRLLYLYHMDHHIGG